MPPTTNNPTDRAREDADDAEWARWEQTFRDAKPVLPEAAMARIEASIRQESTRLATRQPSRLRRRIFLFVAALVAINLIALFVLEHGIHFHTAPSAPPSAKVVATPLLEDRYPMDFTIGPSLVAPDAPLLPLEENLAWANGTGKMLPTRLPTTRPETLELLKAAERLPPDGHHATALLEMRRAAGISAKLPAAFPPGIDEFRIDACWRMLPLHGDGAAQLHAELYALLENSVYSWTATKAPSNAAFWYDVLRNCLPADRRGQLWSDPEDRSEPGSLAFPSHTADRARFDVLTELGYSKAQAALNVLATRSYEPLTSLQEMYPSLPKEQANSRYGEKFLAASRDLFDRLFALRLLGRNQEADDLVNSARKIRYLNDPQDMAILLARLGPDEAWEKLLGPLMEDESAFIANPPKFDESGPRPVTDATVETHNKSVKEGVTTYSGPGTRVLAGPWQITCDKLTAFHNTTHGVLLSGTGTIHVHGVIGLLDASADEVTFNTETGDLKLAGRVHLDGWTEKKDAASCTITRTGEVREVKQ